MYVCLKFIILFKFKINYILFKFKINNVLLLQILHVISILIIYYIICLFRTSIGLFDFQNIMLVIYLKYII